MVLKKNVLKVLAEKPDMFVSTAQEQLTEERIAELRQIPRLAVGEITGCAGMEAFIQILSAQRPDAFLPTVSFTGTEYGSWEQLFQKLEALRKVVENELKIYCTEPLVLGSPGFWRALNGCHADELSRRFSFDSRCCGCRVYACAVRVPLCKMLNARIMIAGHTGQSGSNGRYHNSPLAVGYYSRLMSNFGIELLPGVPDSSRRESLDPDHAFSAGQKPHQPVCCVLDKHTGATEGQTVKPSSVAAFFESFALPAAAKIISRALAGRAVDYQHESAETLKPVEKKPAKRKKRGARHGISA